MNPQKNNDTTAIALEIRSANCAFSKTIKGITTGKAESGTRREILPGSIPAAVVEKSTRMILNLDLRYYDTNLSKENCFVLTGDLNARPGGRIDPVTNPEGLASRWCSATFVAKVWFALN